MDSAHPYPRRKQGRPLKADTPTEQRESIADADEPVRASVPQRKKAKGVANGESTTRGNKATTKVPKVMVFNDDVDYGIKQSYCAAAPDRYRCRFKSSCDLCFEASLSCFHYPETRLKLLLIGHNPSVGPLYSPCSARD
jgi:hypothetical protein